MSEPETVHLTVVHHKHGINSYVNRTQEGADQTLADYCREWWNQWFDDGDLPPKSNEEVIEKYFGEDGAFDYEYADRDVVDVGI